jgi:hypothetical protein
MCPTVASCLQVVRRSVELEVLPLRKYACPPPALV